MAAPTAYRRPAAGSHSDYLYPGYASTVTRSPSKPLILLPQSLTEITGPVFGHDRVRPEDADLTKQHAGEPLGERIIVTGRVMDEDGRPVPHTLVEIWQANAHGRYAHPEDQRDLPLEKNFHGFGRTPTDANGGFRFSTIKPGSVPAANGQMQAPHIMVSVFARGLLKQLVTRIYFSGDDHANDPVMALVPASRRASLIAQPGNQDVLEWNIVLGGGANEGLFGLNFRISGPATAPVLTINPLSALAPGFLRKIFGAGEVGSGQAPQPEPPQAPAPGGAPLQYAPSRGLLGPIR